MIGTKRGFLRVIEWQFYENQFTNYIKNIIFFRIAILRHDSSLGRFFNVHLTQAFNLWHWYFKENYLNVCTSRVENFFNDIMSWINNRYRFSWNLCSDLVHINCHLQFKLSERLGTWSVSKYWRHNLLRI